jgi:Tol biopolymer transport system component
VLPRELAWISEGGRIETLPFPKRPYARLDLTTDGRRIAVGTLEAGRYLLRVLDLDRPSDQALDLPGSSWSPAWHPDGKRLAFVTMKKGDFDSYMVDVTSSAPPAPVLVTEFDESPIVFMPDGVLVVRQSDSGGKYVEKRVMSSGKTEDLAPALAGNTAPSPDGKLIAFESDRSGTSEIYVRTADAGGAPEKVSSAGGTAAAWAPNGRDLLYLREPEIMAVRYTIENGRFKPGAERVWARVDGNYQTEVLKIGPDGRALVAIDRQKTVREIRVIVNWQTEIAKKLK